MVDGGKRILTVFILVLGLLFPSLTFAQYYDILQKTDKVEIPFTFQHNFIIVNIKFDGTLPLKFLFDTGAEHTVLFKRTYADILGLDLGKKVSLVGSDLNEAIYAYISRNVGIQLYPLADVRQDILVLEENFHYLDEMTGIGIDGILGSSFFKGFVVMIDYLRGIITLSSPRDYKPPNRKFQSYPIEIINNKPYIPAVAMFQTLDTARTKLLLDTGAGLSLLLHSNTHHSIQLPEHTITGSLGSGLSGELMGYVGKINSLSLMDVTFNDVITSFQDLDEAIISSDKLVRNGIVGNQILSRFTIIIDYPREILYTRTKGSVNKKFVFDRSGLTVFATGKDLNQFLIHSVIPDSPSDRAGLQTGDIIQSIQRVPAPFYTLSGVTGIFKKRVGKKIRLVVNRDSERKKFVFRLEELI